MVKKSTKKIFVLDTSVLLFDHNAIRHFEDNDVAIPISVLEELDNFKIGNDTNNFEARAVIRFLDKLSADNGDEDWVSIEPKKEKLSLVIKTEYLALDAITVFGSDKNNHQIINAVLSLQMEHKRARRSSLQKTLTLG